MIEIGSKWRPTKDGAIWCESEMMRTPRIVLVGKPNFGFIITSMEDTDGVLFTWLLTPSELTAHFERIDQPSLPLRWKNCNHHRDPGAGFCSVCAFMNRRTVE